jgi:hypothetical protein
LDPQPITNDIGARQPEHLLKPPVPVTVRVVWVEDGEERIDTVALGWSGRNVYVRIADARCRTTAVWLDAADVTRR